MQAEDNFMHCNAWRDEQIMLKKTYVQLDSDELQTKDERNHKWAESWKKALKKH